LRTGKNRLAMTKLRWADDPSPAAPGRLAIALTARLLLRMAKAAKKSTSLSDRRHFVRPWGDRA
jgi:hypothetical protein